MPTARRLSAIGVVTEGTVGRLRCSRGERRPGLGGDGGPARGGPCGTRTGGGRGVRPARARGGAAGRADRHAGGDGRRTRRPVDPQTVLTRLRAAAATPGPLALYLVGQLQVDRRQHLPHLALARSTATTLRYTGLPWRWLAAELAVRRPGTTTVVADLVVDAELWERLGSARASSPSAPASGSTAASPPRRAEAAPPRHRSTCATSPRSGAPAPAPRSHTSTRTRRPRRGRARPCT